jgi:AraC family transcriptional regulator of adaptative response / DNA-3-methyladenine glycosylase II
MPEPALSPLLTPQVCHRAVDDRDPRFDGLFFVAIVTTRIYCRPTCPSRRANPDHRRFFGSVAEAERAGFRACRRCRPELVGQALDSVARLAQTAARRICGGALNGRSVAELAADLGVSERHLRRALRRELGASPVELAQVHRLQLARRLLADTALPVIDVAYASGFESLRRFNAAFRERYGTSPRQARKTQGAAPPRPPGEQFRRAISTPEIR